MMSSSSSTATEVVPYVNDGRFHLFSQLHDELQIQILSFVSDAPLEEDKESASSTTIINNNATATTSANAEEASPPLSYSATLTHVLPLVCKKFYTVYSKSDQLWKDAILRQLLQLPQHELWCEAIQNIIHRTTNRTYLNIIITTTTTNECNVSTDDDKNMKHDDEIKEKHEKACTLIDQAYQVVHDDMQQTTLTTFRHGNCIMSYQYLYRTILNTQLRQVLPVFIMNGDVVLNEPYGLHMFEYRYRYMMQNLMRQHTNMVRQGTTDCSGSSSTTTSTSTRSQLLQQYPIYFIHANRGNVRRSEMAVIVQVLQCDIHPDGRADIVVKPIHFVWIERSWLYTSTINHYLLDDATDDYDNARHRTGKSSATRSQPPPHNLYYAQVLKMGRKATTWMHYLQRRETLANIMERLITSGIIIRDENGIHRTPGDFRQVHLEIFENEDDDDDNDDEEDDDNDDDGNDDMEDASEDR